MDEHILDDALLMRLVTEGDAELLAIDRLLSAVFHAQETETPATIPLSPTERPQ